MILHCVFCNFVDTVTDAAQNDILEKLAEFSKTLDGIIGFDHGPNRDFEKKSQDFNAGFVIRFTDQAALDLYAEHPTHKALGRQLVSLCTDGAEGIIVYDLEIP